jgi:hypothetical protein
VCKPSLIPKTAARMRHPGHRDDAARGVRADPRGKLELASRQRRHEPVVPWAVSASEALIARIDGITMPFISR